MPKRMISLDDSRAVIGATLLTLGYDVNTKDAKQLEEAKTKLAELAKGIKLYDSDSPKTALIAGDVDLGIVWTGDVDTGASRESGDHSTCIRKEGPIIWQDNYAIPKDAPHLDAAYAWLNYSMQPDLFWLMLRDFPYTNPNKGALDYAKQHLNGEGRERQRHHAAGSVQAVYRLADHEYAARRFQGRPSHRRCGRCHAAVRQDLDGDQEVVHSLHRQPADQRNT